MPICWAMIWPAHGPACADTLDGQKHQMSAVEHRDRQQIQDAEIDTEQAHEVEQVEPAGLHLLTGHLGDEDRPAQFRGRDHPLDDLDETQDGQGDVHPGLAGRRRERPGAGRPL